MEEQATTRLLEGYSKHCTEHGQEQSLEGFTKWFGQNYLWAQRDAVRSCIQMAWSKILRCDPLSRQRGFSQLATVAILFGKDVFKNLNSRLKCSVSSRQSGES